MSLIIYVKNASKNIMNDIMNDQIVYQVIPIPFHKHLTFYSHYFRNLWAISVASISRWLYQLPHTGRACLIRTLLI